MLGFFEAKEKKTRSTVRATTSSAALHLHSTALFFCKDGRWGLSLNKKKERRENRVGIMEENRRNVQVGRAIKRRTKEDKKDWNGEKSEQLRKKNRIDEKRMSRRRNPGTTT